MTTPGNDDSDGSGAVTRGGAPLPESDDERTLERILRGAGPRDVPSAAAMQDVRAAVEAEWRAIVESRHARVRRWAWPVAAGVAAAALGVAVLLNRPSAPLEIVATVERLDGGAELRGSASQGWQPVTVGATIRQEQEVRTTGTGRLALALANGLRVRVDHESQLAFADLGHAALEAGAVYVDSGPTSANPPAALEIDTRYGRVSHLGTQYEARIDGDSLVVSVREGRVSVERGADRVEGAAGERLVINDGRPVERSLLARSAPDWSWTGEIAPAYRLEGQSLYQFLEWAARETGREVRYAGGAARDDASAVELHGSVDGLTPDQALTAVLATTSLPVDIGSTRIEVGDRVR
jgi:ferric-dicitrate binding protein FerR (iron transport regulator)